jgi:DNA-binding NtrC family response regulator
MPEPSILVVDDEPAVSWALEALFRMHGYHVCAVPSGAEAVAVLAHRQFTHILLDAKLQDADGLVLADQIRGLAPHAAVLLISAYYYGDEVEIACSLRRGLIHGFIPKPFLHHEVLRCLADAWKVLNRIP